MAQNIILLSDVPGLGQVGDRCKVKDGYARNYLFPEKLAVLATQNIINKTERQKEKLEAHRKKQLGEAQKVAETLSKVGLVFERPVGLGGRLFGSVTPFDIMTEMTKQGATIEKRSILMDGPIRTAGDHKIRVRVHSKVVVDIPVVVKAMEEKKSDEVAVKHTPAESDVSEEKVDEKE